MARALAALALLVLSASACLWAPPPKDGPVYFPTKAGARWVYLVKLGEVDRPYESVEVVTAVEQKGGATLVTVGHESQGEVMPHHVMSVSSKGVFVTSAVGGEMTEPFCVLRLPHRPGNKWEAVFAGKQWGRVVGTAAAFGPEEVEVPAGKYQAVRVESETPFIDGRKGSAKATTWYAAGVGVVKEVRADAGSVRVLKEFTPGTD